MSLGIMTSRLHPTPGPERSATIVSSLALQPINVEYFGHPCVLFNHFQIATGQLIVHLYRAHAGRAPWEGRNALDAAVVAYSSISALRQQMKVDCVSTNHSFLPIDCFSFPLHSRRIVFMESLRDGTGPRIVRTHSFGP
jgi:hypothetical protein